MAVRDGNMNGVSGTATQAQLDLFDAPLAMPVNKLDADQYSAEDLDGVTESIFGSGNMAHATLQASQTDAGILMDGNLFDAIRGGEGAFEVSGSGSAGAGSSFAADGDSAAQEGGSIAPFAEQGRIADDKGGISVSDSGSGGGSFASGTVGSLGASTLSSDVGGFSSSSNLGLNNSNVDTQSDAETTVTNNAVTNNHSDTTNHNNVTNITNNNVDDTIQKLITTINETVEHITELGDEIITNVLEGDVLENIEVLLTEINDLTQNLSTTINNVTDVVNNLYDSTVISEVVNNVTNVTNGITEIITNNIDNILGGLTVDLAADVLDTLGTDLNLIVDKGVIGELSTALVTENAFDLVSDLTGLNTALIDNTAIDVGFGLLTGQDVDDGNDITVQGITTPDIDLDIIEDIIGDIDINIALPTDLSEPAALGESLEESLNGLGDLDLAAPDEIIESVADEGIDGALDVILAEESLLSEEFDVEVLDILDQAQELIDDVAEADTISDGAVAEIVEGAEDVLDVLEPLGGDGSDDGVLEEVADVAENIVNEVLLDSFDEEVSDEGDESLIEEVIEVSETVLAEAQEILEEAEEGLGELVENVLFGADVEDSSDSESEDESWTESVVNGEGLFDDVLGGLGGNDDVLPDPTGSIAEGIGALDVEPDLDLGGLGGLFG